MSTDNVTVEQKNIAIAKFMGEKIVTADNGDPVIKTKNNRLLHISDWAKYHEDWNQLMAVVEKIESINDDFHGYFGVHVNSNGCTIQGTNLRTDPENFHPAYYNEAVHDTKILATHKAIYDFITWYTTTIQKD